LRVALENGRTQRRVEASSKNSQAWQMSSATLRTCSGSATMPTLRSGVVVLGTSALT
jgi:hypothetical protein